MTKWMSMKICIKYDVMETKNTHHISKKYTRDHQPTYIYIYYVDIPFFAIPKVLTLTHSEWSRWAFFILKSPIKCHEASVLRWCWQIVLKSLISFRRQQGLRWQFHRSIVGVFLWLYGDIKVLVMAKVCDLWMILRSFESKKVSWRYRAFLSVLLQCESIRKCSIFGVVPPPSSSSK